MPRQKRFDELDARIERELAEKVVRHGREKIGVGRSRDVQSVGGEQYSDVFTVERGNDSRRIAAFERDGLDLGGLRRRVAVGLEQLLAFEQRFEIKPSKRVAHGGGEGKTQKTLVERVFDRHVPVYLGELVRQVRRVLARAQFFALTARYTVDVSINAVERAVLRDERGGGLFADAGHARDIVGGIARKRLVIDHAVGGHAEYLRNVVGRDLDYLGYALFCKQSVRVAVDEL